MAKQKREKTRFALLVDEWKLGRYDSDSSHYRVSVVRIDPGDHKPRNCSRSLEYESPGQGIFEDLEISVYMAWRNGEFTANMWDAEYRDVYSIDIDKAHLMLKGLRKVSGIIKGFPLQPTSFGQFAVLLAAGLGVKECVRTAEGSVSHGYYPDGEWWIGPLSAAQGIIDREVDGVREKMMPAAVAEVA